VTIVVSTHAGASSGLWCQMHSWVLLNYRLLLAAAMHGINLSDENENHYSPRTVTGILTNLTVVSNYIVTSVEGGYVFKSVCLSVCLSVYPLDN